MYANSLKYYQGDASKAKEKALVSTIRNLEVGFEMKYGRKPTPKEAEWANSTAGLSIYAAYSGNLGRTMTDSEVALIRERKGYKLFGITDAEHAVYETYTSIGKEIEEYDEYVFAIIGVYTQIRDDWEKDLYQETTTRDKIKEKYQIDVLDIDETIRLEIFNKAVVYGFEVGRSQFLVNTFEEVMKLSIWAESKPQQIKEVKKYGFENGKPVEYTEYYTSDGKNIVKDATVRFLTDAEAKKVGLLKENPKVISGDNIVGGSSGSSNLSKPDDENTVKIHFRRIVDDSFINTGITASEKISIEDAKSVLYQVAKGNSGKVAKGKTKVLGLVEGKVLVISDIKSGYMTLSELKELFHSIGIEIKEMIPDYTIEIDKTVSKKEITIFANDKLAQLDVKPFIENKRTLSPIRGVFETLGGKVDWNQAKKEVTIVKDDLKMLFTINSKDVYINGEKHTIDVALKIVNNRTFVPLRFISETLGYNVEWDNDSYGIVIDTKKTI